MSHFSLRFGAGKHLPLVLQEEAAECALACLTMILNYHGDMVTLRDLRVRFPISMRGTTLTTLAYMADVMGLVPRAVRLELDELADLQMPAILHWKFDHFVVIKAVRRGRIFLHDPALGELSVPMHEVSECFTGIALELAPGLKFQRTPARTPLRLKELAGEVTGMKRGLAQLLVLALALEVFGLAPALIQQWITDEALVRGDEPLLQILCLGLVGVGLTNAAIGLVRSWVGLFISTHFNLQWTSNVMGRLMRLPVSFFEQRHVGDIVSRFGAVQSIEHGLTSAVIEAFLDGLLAVGTLCIMVMYAPKLAAVSVIAVALYSLLRASRYSAERMASAGMMAKQAREQSYFLETIRGVRTIKLANRENERRAAWLNFRIEVINAGLKLQRLNLAFGTGWSILSTLERTGVMWLGAEAVMRNDMTLGMLFAFLSLKEQFSARATQLINRYVDFRMLGVSAERLADIVLTEPEEKRDYRKHELPIEFSLSLDRVTFRYGRHHANILRNATLTVAPGECIAIVGPSGSGKTTCLKLLLGILKPLQGRIQVGGLTLEQLGLQAYRNLIATVLQDDQRFAGSIFDNIAFLDERPQEEWLYECARTAQIHDEIIAMPMGYHSLVGDMGTVLSGGQKQRVLLARALYRRPKILFLDEATSHLDLENESRIAAALASLKMTRIMIAHRPQTIAIADRVLILKDGQLVEDTPAETTTLLNVV